MTKPLYGPLEHWTDSLIHDAMARGDFDHLPGKGQPLNLADPDPYAGPEADGYKILKNAGFTPEWITLRRSIAEEITWLREHAEHPDRISRIAAVNLLIAQHNRLIPQASLSFPKVPQTFGQTVR